MCPTRPVESGDSWSSGCVTRHRHIHILAVLLIIWSSKKNPTASRAGTGTPTPPAMTLAGVSRCKGTADRGCGQKYREPPPQEQHGVQSDTRITIAVQRKLDAKCTPEMLKATAQ